jgi:hypothetical protein
MTREEMLAFYAAPGIFTGVDGFENDVAAVSSDVVSIVEFVQGLLIHEALGAVYGTTQPPARTAEKQIHAAELMFTQAKRLDAGALAQARPPAKRVIGVCRHFATLFVALMRSKGIPCRARCGFANYFIPGKHVDHWVAEYWRADQGRWILVDVQVDEPQRQLYRVDFDTLDVPRDRFLVGGDAWRACRNGADPMNFGIAGTPIWGLVEVYGDVFQDLAALQKIELLPWGWYGLAKDKNGMEETALIDSLADISSTADASSLEKLRAAIARDSRLEVPAEMIAAIVAGDGQISN